MSCKIPQDPLEMVLVLRQMYGVAAAEYFLDCAVANREMDDVIEQVEITVCTNVYINGDS